MFPSDDVVVVEDDDDGALAHTEELLYSILLGFPKVETLLLFLVVESDAGPEVYVYDTDDDRFFTPGGNFDDP